MPPFVSEIPPITVTADDGVDLSVLDSGGPRVSPEAPTILLIHGFGGSKEDFVDQMGWLGTTHRVITFDHRGHGASAAPADPGAYSPDRLTADALAVLDALDVDRFRVLGHSMGGLMARRIAVRLGERVEAVVFMDSLLGSVPGVDRPLAEVGAEIARTRGMEVLNALLEEASPTTTVAYTRLLETRPGYREFQARRQAAQSAVMWASLVVQLTEVPDATQELASIKCPVLVLVGELDEAFLPAASGLAEAIPQSQLVVIPDAGHSPQFENPVVFDTVLGTFLATLTPARRPSP